MQSLHPRRRWPPCPAYAMVGCGRPIAAPLATGRGNNEPSCKRVRPMTMTRRHILQAGAAGASLVAMRRFQASEANEAAGAGGYADAWPVLDALVEQYMRDMNSPEIGRAHV